MFKMTRNSLKSLVAVLLMTGSGCIYAQEAVNRAEAPMLKSPRCPQPHVITQVAPPPAAATPYAPDFPSIWNLAGAAFNQTQTNKHFGHTFLFTRVRHEML